MTLYLDKFFMIYSKTWTNKCNRNNLDFQLYIISTKPPGAPQTLWVAFFINRGNSAA